MDVLAGKPITRERLSRLVSRYPAVAEIADWPLQLLRFQDQCRNDVLRAMRPYKAREDADELDASTGRVFTFPGTTSTNESVELSNLSELLERGDIYGFFGLLAQFRLMHAERQADMQCFAARYLVRSVAGACLHPCMRSQASELIYLTKRLLITLPTLAVPVRMDETCLSRLVKAGTAYREGATEDPLIHYRLSPCPADKATPLWGSLDLKDF